MDKMKNQYTLELYRMQLLPSKDPKVSICSREISKKIYFNNIFGTGTGPVRYRYIVINIVQAFL
jgi:hypothetical protein